MNSKKLSIKALEIFLNDGLVLLIYRSRRFLTRIIGDYIEFVRYVWMGSRRIIKNDALEFVFLDEVDVLLEVPNFTALDKYVNKTFCLLELTWVDCGRGVTKKDLVGSLRLESVNQSNQKYSFTLLKLVSDDYRFCDWALSQLPKQNWPLDVWASRIEFGSDGRDIKHAWELGRLNWLPQIAVSASQRQKQPDWQTKVYRECYDVVLDFMAFNPVGFGVHWICPMDISIRLINILITMQLLGKKMRQYDPKSFDCAIEICILHKQWIESHLEDWDVRTNHYLSNLLALSIFESMFTHPSRNEVLPSLVFDRLFEEVDSQFLTDGGHFERSLGYHNMLTEGIALFLWLLSKTKGDALKRQLVSRKKTVIEKISRAFVLSELTTVCDGSYPLIGDFDSGSFVKIYPRYLKLNELERIFRGNIPPDLADPEYEATFVNFSCLKFISLARDGWDLEPNIEVNKMVFGLGSFKNIETEACMDVSKWAVDTSNFEFYSFPDFGLVMFGDARWFFSVRAIGELPSYGHGHLHEDQLSVCIWNDGVWYWADPGSGTYTGDKFVRNVYRSVLGHFPTRQIFPVCNSFHHEDIFGSLEIPPVNVESKETCRGKTIEFAVENQLLLSIIVGATEVSIKFKNNQKNMEQFQLPVSFNYGLY